MLVKDLIKLLSEEDPNSLVVMSTDAEGNGYSTLADAEPGYSFVEEGWGRGEIGFAQLTPELKAKGYTKSDLLTDGKPAIILWPN